MIFSKWYSQWFKTATWPNDFDDIKAMLQMAYEAGRKQERKNEREYNAETDKSFDEYLKTIFKTCSTEITPELRDKLIMTMQQAQESQKRFRII